MKELLKKIMVGDVIVVEAALWFYVYVIVMPFIN